MRTPQQNRPPRRPNKPQTTSWEPVEKWYQGTVGDEGHYYHKHVVIPGVLRLLELDKATTPSLLDVACGQGVLARQIPTIVNYTGVDISPSLIKNAKVADAARNHLYMVADALKALPLTKRDFTHAAIVLAIQNMKEPKLAFDNIAKHLAPGGKLVIAMNHPCFRVPRQSSWKVDDQQKVQYRRIDRYSSSMEIPIHAHPSKGEESVSTLSFHHPLASYSLWLHQAGFAIELIEEWHSNKVSTGGAAKMENRSRMEIPLFLAIRAIKIS
jgi:Methylase involved in ubiquinone/menaquinone biosynthesis